MTEKKWETNQSEEVTFLREEHERLQALVGQFGIQVNNLQGANTEYVEKNRELQRQLDVQTKRASFLLDRCVWMDNQIDTLKRTIEHVKMAAISVGTVK